MIFTGVWYSNSADDILGIYLLDIPESPLIDKDIEQSDVFNATLTLKYDPRSRFRPDITKVFKIKCIYSNRGGDSRIVCQTDLSREQLIMLTIIFKDAKATGYYSTLLPVDYGTFKCDQPSAKWVDFLANEVIESNV